MSVPWYLMAKGKGGGGYKTASGPIVSISDALAAPLRSLRVGIDPVQDLHGYDAPWPGGGGKNLLNAEYTESITLSKVITFDTPLPTGTYTFSFVSADTASQVASYQLGVYKDTTAAYSYYSVSPSTKKQTFTIAETCSKIVLYSNKAYTESVGFTTVFTGLQVELGSTATTYSPYSNECPISGWSAANLWRTGKNLLDVSDYQIETSSAYNKSAGTTLTFGGTGASVSGTNPIEIAVTTGWRGATFFSKPLKVGTTYYLRYRITAPSPGYIKRTIYWVDDDNKIVVNLGYSSSVDQSAEYVYHNTLTPPQDGLRLAFVVESQTSQTVTIYDMGVMVGGWETYTPYTGTTIPITFTEAGTVYGGVWDVVGGVLRVDRVCDTITKDSAWYGFSTGTGNSSAVVQLTEYQNVKFIAGISSRNGAISSTGKEASNYWVNSRQNEVPSDGDMCFAYSSTGQLRFHRSDVSNITDLASFKTNFQDTQILYYLAQPITYTLTPQQLDTLAGQNVVWADCGDVTVEYLSAGGANPDLMKLAVAFMGR